MVPSELEAMQVYSPESWKLIGWISKPPDCKSVNLGTWTEPLAKTCDPTETGNNKIALRWTKVIRSLSTFSNYEHITSVCLCLCVHDQSVWSITFTPGDGGLWSAGRLAGKQGCVAISYCLVRGRECKCGGRTWNTGREHERKEHREIATEREETGGKRVKLRQAKRKQESGKRKHDSVDLNTNASYLINGGFIHFLVLQYVHVHKCDRWWWGSSVATFNYNVKQNITPLRQIEL